MESSRFRCVFFGQLLPVDKQKVPYSYKTTSKKFEFFHKSYAMPLLWQQWRIKMADILALIIKVI
jgi:hypothetical protein